MCVNDTKKQTNKEKKKQRNKETKNDRQTDRQKERKKQTNKQRMTDRQKGRKKQRKIKYGQLLNKYVKVKIIKILPQTPAIGLKFEGPYQEKGQCHK